MLVPVSDELLPLPTSVAMLRYPPVMPLALPAVALASVKLAVARAERSRVSTPPPPPPSSVPLNVPAVWNWKVSPPVPPLMLPTPV